MSLCPLLLLLLAVNLATVHSRRVIRAAPGEETTGSYIVVLTPDTNHTRFETIVDKVKNESEDHNITEKVEGPFAKIIAAKISEEAAHRLKHQEGVEFIEEETYAYGTRNAPWHIDRIDQACTALDNSTFRPCECGRGVDIYILDSGINYGHCEFGGRAQYPGYDPVDNYERTNRRGQDCHGHGTHVASLAAGNTYGVARCATVYSVRVLRCDNSAPWSVVIDGVNYAARLITQRNPRRPAVISMSLGGSFFRSLDSVVTTTINNGIPVVVAAGNARSNACTRSPASNQGAITVGGTAKSDDVYYYTNGGSCVDILAPGSSITGASHTCTSCTCTKVISGTSQATPLVAGAVGLILQKEPNLSPSNVTLKLKENCIKDAISFYYLPSSLRTTTPNCLLHIKPCPSGCNSTGTVTRVVTQTMTMTAVVSPSPVPSGNSFCCAVLQNFQNIQRNVMSNVSSVLSNGVNSIDQLVTSVSSGGCIMPTPLQTP